jgi:hypothetical protein
MKSLWRFHRSDVSSAIVGVGLSFALGLGSGAMARERRSPGEEGCAEDSASFCVQFSGTMVP